jgi:hypothetical protein
VTSVNERMELSDGNTDGTADVHDVDITVLDELVERRSPDTEHACRVADTQQQFRRSRVSFVLARWWVRWTVFLHEWE